MLVSRGLTNRQIAAELSISEHTVRLPHCQDPQEARLELPLTALRLGGRTRYVSIEEEAIRGRLISPRIARLEPGNPRTP